MDGLIKRKRKEKEMVYARDQDGKICYNVNDIFKGDFPEVLLKELCDSELPPKEDK